jgi:hypothetical protein
MSHETEEALIAHILPACLNPPPTTEPENLSRILGGVAREIFLEERYAESRARSARASAAAARKRGRARAQQPTLDAWIFR